MISRDLAPRLLDSAKKWPSLTLTGPRQSGKTTLCRALFPRHAYSSLEALDTRAFAKEDPRAYLAQFKGGAILDEVQRVPELLSYLQEVVDNDPTPGRWILTGSQDLALLNSIDQSLAGRTAVHNLHTLTHGEVIRFAEHPQTIDEALVAGSYPGVFDRKHDPSDWFSSYVATYIERDVRSITNVNDLSLFERFVRLCAGRTAQPLSLRCLAWDCGVSQPTARAWIGILETHFLVFRLPAFHSNTRKRLTKMPKLHFYDTGLVCWLMGIRTEEQLRAHPVRGAIFESWMVSEIAKHRTNAGVSQGLSFYRDRRKTESDLIIQDAQNGRLLDAKSACTPSPNLLRETKRVQKNLSRSGYQFPITVVYDGDQLQFQDSDSFVPWKKLHEFDWIAASTKLQEKTG